MSLPEEMARLSFIEKPRYALFVDFDETYLAHHPTPEDIRAREALEDQLMRDTEPDRMLFIWLTGSTLASVVHKCRAHKLRMLPHIVASSVGAEIDLISRMRGFEKLAAWETAIAESGFDSAKVDEVIRKLQANGISLRRQKQRGSRIESYYYMGASREDETAAVSRIRAEAEALGLGVNVSVCNPRVGDPEGAYDVDFFPRVCGKANTVRFLQTHFGISRDRTLAFGDSMGDLGMLEAVGHGFLVQNATPSARDRFHRVARGRYAHGIQVELDAYLKTIRPASGPTHA